jgi:hypothetical protein
MMETEIVQLYKYTIRYKPGEMDEYTVILVSDNIRDLIDLIADREMIDPINGARKWLEIADFVLVIKENEKWYHLFDINEQDLAAKFGYDVQEQYWTVLFKNDAPEPVKNNDEILWNFENKIGDLNNDDEWAKRFASSGVLGEALYGSKYVQDVICEKKREKDLHDAEELDAGIGVIEEIVKGECEK